MKVKAKINFRDIHAKVRRAKDKVFEVSKERGEHLIDIGFAEKVDDPLIKEEKGDKETKELKTKVKTKQ